MNDCHQQKVAVWFTGGIIPSSCAVAPCRDDGRPFQAGATGGTPIIHPQVFISVIGIQIFIHGVKGRDWLCPVGSVGDMLNLFPARSRVAPCGKVNLPNIVGIVSGKKEGLCAVRTVVKVQYILVGPFLFGVSAPIKGSDTARWIVP